jgi:Ca2+-binding EF-hand superfamily protein
VRLCLCSLSTQEFKKIWTPRFLLKDVPAARMDAFFDACDTDKSGNIGFRELAQAIGALPLAVKEAKLKRLFDLYDEDHSGELAGEEIETIVGQMARVGAALGRTGPEDIAFVRSIVTKLDVNGDGSVSPQEWEFVGLKNPAFLAFLGVLDDVPDL